MAKTWFLAWYVCPTMKSWFVLIGFILIYSLFVHARSYSSNDASRLATIESLVERDTWTIEDSRFATVDRIKVGEHFYSDKPPTLSFLGAGVYYVLYHGLGWKLQATGCAADVGPN
ncbi:MAG: hypothetical protein AB1791_11295, partial [Chloroflexota bacterium]